MVAVATCADPSPQREKVEGATINTGASVRFLKDRALRSSQNEGNFFSRNPDLEYRPQDDRDWCRNLSNALKDAAALCRRLNFYAARGPQRNQILSPGLPAVSTNRPQNTQ